MTNRLQKETSPYLRQHADNPVDWYPWGEEALELARREDRPILLSIGYSTCHWCHVMAHESFENQIIAEQMNRQFVNVKVDREERPDLDKVYQTCHQILHRRTGGWPLTVFLNPHTQLPFYTATYIPSRPRQGIAGLPEVLDSLSEHYVENRGKINSVGQQFEAVFRKLEVRTPMPSRDLSLAEKAVSQAMDSYDHECGGFGSPPKFPMPQMLQLLWWHGGDKGRTIVRHHLTTMMRSGCFDQLGGGFFRYATDRHWKIPHFEKMLYDNALLLSLLAPLARRDAEFARSAQAVAAWLLREMRAPGGGFYAAVDADSEGSEGLFYLWTREEIAALLEEGSSHYRLLQRWLNIDAKANFEGRLHLHQRTSLALAAEALDLSDSEASAMADSAITTLLRHRQLRIAPTTDTKVLTAWNALAIVGLMDLAEAISEPSYAEAALDALTFIRDHLWIGGCLYATWQWREDGQGAPRYEGYLDDYAMVAAAIYRCLQWRWDNDLAYWLEAILEQILSRFDDGDNGLNFTDRHSPPLILRERDFLDSVTPSGNGVAALHLNRAGHLFANQHWLGAAERIVAAGWEDACQQPTNAYTLLRAAVELDNPPTLVILQGPNAEDWLTAINALHGNIHAFVVPANAPIPMAGGDEVDAATVCRQHYCQGPAYTLEELLALVGG